MSVLAFTYDFAAAPSLSAVRLLVSDTDSTRAIFGDEEITYFLSLESENVHFAASRLLLSLASNSVRLSGVIQLLDVKLSLGDAAKSYAALAQQLRDTALVDDSSGFAIAEMVVNQFSARERFYGHLLRTGG